MAGAVLAGFLDRVVVVAGALDHAGVFDGAQDSYGGGGEAALGMPMRV